MKYVKILEEAENQYGNKIPVDSIVKIDGIYFKKTLSCWSAEAAGMGNCHCNSHNCWEYDPMSIGSLKANGINLTTRELAWQLNYLSWQD